MMLDSTLITALLVLSLPQYFLIYNLQITNESNKNSFDDTKDHWAASYIEAVKKAGFMNGDGDRKFKPDEFVSYEQLSVVLVRIFKIPLGNQIINHGSLVISSWAEQDVIIAIDTGLMDAIRKPDFTIKVDRATIVMSIFSIYDSYQRDIDVRRKLKDLK
jgi:hypothetical protein